MQPGTRYRRSTYLLALGVCGLILGMSALLRMTTDGDMQSTLDDTAPAGDPEPSHDPDALRNLRILDDAGRWDIRVDQVTLRRRTFGFLQIGAFNVAEIDGLRITLHASTDIGEIAGFLRRLHPNPWRGGTETQQVSADAKPGDSGRSQGGSERIHQRDPANVASGARASVNPLFFGFNTLPANVSSVEIRNVSLNRGVAGQPDALMVRADRLTPGRTSDSVNLRLTGHVALFNGTGQRIETASATIRLDNSPMIILSRGILYDPASTQAFESATVPLARLLGDDPFDIVAQPSRKRAY